MVTLIVERLHVPLEMYSFWILLQVPIIVYMIPRYPWDYIGFALARAQAHHVLSKSASATRDIIGVFGIIYWHKHDNNTPLSMRLRAQAQ
jgi:hypothetical protein